VDLDDPDLVLDAVVDRQMELQTVAGLPIFVVTERPAARVAAMLKAMRAKKRSKTPAALLQD
jgi:hypothetical protein